MNQKVSILMAAYNSELYIEEAIESILRQTHSNFELIIVNDGSIDATELIINKYREDTRIRYYKNEYNRGLTYTRNRLLELVTADFVAIMDSDDVAMPSRLEEQLLFFEKNPSIGLLGTWVQPIDSTGKEVGGVWASYDQSKYIPAILLFQNFFANSSVMMRRAKIPQEGYRNEYPPAEDYDLWIRMIRNTNAYNLPKVLVKYRVHGMNISYVKENIVSSNVKTLLSNQLLALGVEPEEKELSIHYDVSGFETSTYKEENLSEISQWLQKLIIANRKTKVYPEEVLNYVVSKYWFRVCSVRRKFSLTNYYRVSGLRFFYPGVMNMLRFHLNEMKKLFGV